MFNARSILLLIFLFKDVIALKKYYTNSQIWQICDRNQNFLNYIIESNELDVWKSNQTCIDVLINPPDGEKLMKLLDHFGIYHKVLNENFQNITDREQSRRIRSFDDLSNFEQYHRSGFYTLRLTYLLMERMLVLIEEQQHQMKRSMLFASIDIIGYTYEKRPIKLFRLSRKSYRPSAMSTNLRVWIDGGLHSHEWLTTHAVNFLIKKICETYRTDRLFGAADWYFLPIANPDGYTYAYDNERHWRKNRKLTKRNCLGVNLNRNFGYHWKSSNDCSWSYPGPHPFSEFETRAIRNYMLNKSFYIDLYVSLHSSGHAIMYPFSYSDIVPEEETEIRRVAVKAAEAIYEYTGTMYRIGPAARLGYPSSGTSEDWVHVSMDVTYAYRILLGTYGIEFENQFDDRQPAAKDTLAAIRSMVSEISQQPRKRRK